MNQLLPVAKPTGVRYEVLAWACSLSMLTYIDRVCIKVVQEPMSEELGLSADDFGLVFFAFSAAYAAFEIPSGWLGDRFGPRLVLARIVLWWSLFTALTGCVPLFFFDSGLAIPLPFDREIPLVFGSLGLLVLIRFLFGAGEAGAYPNAARALRNWFAYGQRGFAQGLLWTFGRWGGAAAPLLCSALAAVFGWRGAFIVFGIMGVLWTLAFVWSFRNTPREHPRVNDAERVLIAEGNRDATTPTPLSWRTLLLSPTLWLLSTMYFCSNAGWYFFITWDVKYYRQELQLKDLPLQIASGAPLFFGGIACLLGGFTTDRQVRIWGKRWGRTFQGFLAYFLGGACFLAALMLHDPVWSVVFLCLASFTKDFAMAVSWSTCLDIGHRHSGTVSGFMNMVGNFGGGCATLLVVWLAGKDPYGQPADWSRALLFSAAMFLIAAVCWLLIEPRRVVVYNPRDREQLKDQGIIEG